LIVSLIPSPVDFANLGAVWGAGLVLLLWGRALTLGRGWPEIQVVAGWGGMAIVLTLWGVLVPAPLWWPVAAIAAVALVALFVPSMAPTREDWTALGRILVLALPIWAVMLTARPSQPDTFLNLLPNAAYLYDHGLLPTDARPPSHSFLPGAPYNMQFWAYLAGVALPQLPPSAMAHINVLLHLLMGLLLARVVQSFGRETARAPGWGATAFGLLLATGLNPGFVPRIYFAAYSEASVAVSLAIAGWLVAQSLGAAVDRQPQSPRLWALALVLAALVTIKQETVSFVAALAATSAILGLADRRIGIRRALLLFGPAFLPAAALYLVWRWFVLSAFSSGELKLLPFEQWHWELLPQILARIGEIVAEKGVFFGFLLVAFVLLGIQLARRGFDLSTRLLAVLAGTWVCYNLFLLFTYIAHFTAEMSGDAHSYFRYSTHLSLLLVIALTASARAFYETRGWAPSWSWRRVAAGATVVAIVAMPIGFAKRLRFDLAAPQPLVRALGRDAATFLTPDDKLALVVPGDNNSVATMLQSVLRYESPRRPSLDLTVIKSFDEGTLAMLATRGFSKALISCTPDNSAVLPERKAVLVERHGDQWESAAVWRYPEPDGARWGGILAPAPLCRRLPQ